MAETPIDKVAEEFWMRYSKGNPNWRPDIIDNTEGRLKAYQYFQETQDAEREYLSEIANKRFIG